MGRYLGTSRKNISMLETESRGFGRVLPKYMCLVFELHFRLSKKGDELK